MNYQHAYHAGSFSDVIKHVLLTALIKQFFQKPTPFCYIDTHAGAGYYDLFSEFSKKTNEFNNGIERVIQKENPPFLIKQYLRCIHQINNHLTGSTYSSLRYYPGSTMIAQSLIRNQDRIIACELQPQTYQALKNTFIGNKQVSVHHLDGFIGLKAFLPPQERRGFVLIDPPYENPAEFSRLVLSLGTAIKRFETGTYAIWYPIKDKVALDKFYRTIKQNIHLKVLVIEVTIYPDLPNHLNGSGMIIINPPWKLYDDIKQVLPWLWNTLSVNKQGHYNIRVL